MQEAELRLDWEELKKLEGQATRPNVKNVIHIELKRIEQCLAVVLLEFDT